MFRLHLDKLSKSNYTKIITNLPAFHHVVVFLCVKSVPVPHVRPKERFLVGRVGPREYRLYRCIARYGYRDVHKDDTEFEKDLVCSIAEFIYSEKAKSGARGEGTEENEKMTVVGTVSSNLEGVGLCEDKGEACGSRELTGQRRRKRVRFLVPENRVVDRDAEREMGELREAREAGMAFILGHSYVRAKRGSSWLKRVVINYGYDFLRKNSRGPSYAVSIPYASTLEVGIVYYV